MFGDVLTPAQCDKLIADLAACTFPFQCAHGRPTIVPILGTCFHLGLCDRVFPLYHVATTLTTEIPLLPNSCPQTLQHGRHPGQYQTTQSSQPEERHPQQVIAFLHSCSIMPLELIVTEQRATPYILCSTISRQP